MIPRPADDRRSARGMWLALPPGMRGKKSQWAARPPAPTAGASTPSTVRLPPGAARGSTVDDQRYAAREAASPDAKQYKGGDVIVISVTAAVIVLLVVVILILL